MSIQDLIQIINTQLPDNNQQLITEAILRGVLDNMVNTLSSELRVFNINSSQVTDNEDSTYSITGVENALMNAIAIDEKLNIFQFDGTVWTLKVDATMFATAEQGTKADTSLQPGDNMSELNDDTDFIDDVIAGDNITIDKTDPKKPVFYGQSVAVPEYASKDAAIADVGLGLNYPFSIEGDDTAYVKKDTGFVSTWDTTLAGVSASDEIALPLEDTGTYNFDVWYGGQLLKTITAYTDNVIQFPDGSGTKQIVCVGQLEGFRFSNGGDKDKILSISHFGDHFKLLNGYSVFYGCSNLTEVGVLDTAGVTTMSNMFRECSSLTTLDVSGWDVSSVTSMSNMFFGCTSLTTLDVSSWNVSSVTNMRGTFQSCSSLTTLDVSNWDTSSVTECHWFVYDCTSLTDLPVQNWNIENVSNFLNFANNVTIPTATYNQILTNWSIQNVQPSLNINFGNSQYSAAGQAGRDDLINNHGWTITDGGSV